MWILSRWKPERNNWQHQVLPNTHSFHFALTHDKRCWEKNKKQKSHSSTGFWMERSAGCSGGQESCHIFVSIGTTVMTITYNNEPLWFHFDLLQHTGCLKSFNELSICRLDVRPSMGSISRKTFFWLFLTTTTSVIKCSQLISIGKFGPTASSFGSNLKVFGLKMVCQEAVNWAQKALPKLGVWGHISKQT